MKKKIFIIFSLFIAFFFFSFVKLRASGTITMTDGAQIRTTEPAGLRFEATIGGAFEGFTIEYGFALSRGEFTKTQMESKLASGKAIKVPCGDPDGEGKIFVTITNIPESAYSSDITAIAYVNVDGEDYFADIAVTRNITEVATAYAGLIDSDFIDAIVNCNTHMVKTTLATTNEFVLTHIVSRDYGFSDLDFLWADFINDYNKATGATLTTSSTADDLFTSMGTGISTNAVRAFPSNCNAVKFFSGKNLVKWGWLLDFFSTYGSFHGKNQAAALLRSDRTCQDYDGYKVRHLAYSIHNLFNNLANDYGWATGTYKFGTESAYDNVPFPTATNLSGANVVNVGDDIDLPAAVTPTAGYSWSCYKVGITEYAAESSYEVTTSEVAFVPIFTPITYSITYHENGGSAGANPTSYNIETATFALIDGTKADYDFGGWYRNSSFTEGPVTSIPKGSTGDIDLYAKWLDPVPVELDIDSYNAANKTVLSTVTPDILVIPGITSGRYKIINTGNDGLTDKVYVYGTTLFATVKAAVESAGSSGKTIYAFSGTYSDAFTINKTLTLLGACYNLEMKHSDTFTEDADTQSIISGAVTVSGCSAVSVRGFVMENRMTISGVTGISISNVVCNTSLDGVFLFNTSASSNAEFDKIFQAGSSPRVVYVKVKLTGLTFQNSAVLDGATVSGSYNVDTVRFGETTSAHAYGNIVIRNNYFRAYQSGFMDRNPSTATSYTIENNYFKDMEVAIYFRTATVSITQSHTIRYNTIVNCGSVANNWDVLNITNGTNTTTYLNYNVFVDSDFGTNGKNTDYIIMIRNADKGTFNLSNNYFWNTTRNDTADFGNTYCVKNPPASGGLTLWSLETATTTPNTYDPYQVVQIGGKYYIYGVNLTTPAS